jgi:fibronectin-binding autotransporter adhesin
MKTIPPSQPRWIVTILAFLAMAVSAMANVNLTATTSAGSVAVAPGGSFTVTLTWAGTPAIAAADYALTLNTSQLVYSGRTFNAGLPPYADSLYRTTPVATNRVDLTWFKAGGFIGNDVTLQFTVPANYTGPAVVTLGLAVAGVQDATTTSIVTTTTGTTVNVATTSIVSIASSSGTAPRTANWVTGTNALVWSSGNPGIGSNPDQATLNLSSTSTSGDFGVDLNQNLTLNKLTVNMAGTVNYRLGTGTRRAITWMARGSETAVLEFVPVSGVPLRNSIDSNSVLSTDLLARFAFQGSKDSYFGGIVSGSGKLSVEYYNNVNNSTAGNLRIGTAGDAASTHTGGTKLAVTAAAITPANFRFWAAKAEAFGTGMLELNGVRLDLNAFNQTVGGLGDGAGGSLLTDISTSTANTSTSTLTLNFSSSAGTRSFSGQINDGATRKIALIKSGTGTQLLSGVNSYTGTTTISGGKLTVNGSLAAGSTTTIQASGTLGGSGSVNGTTVNQGTLAPGDSLGTLTTGATTMSVASKLDVQVANWTSSTAGSGWDLLNCNSLALAGSSAQPVVIKLTPASLVNFSEVAKTFTVATSVSAITGFSATTVSVDASAMPGTGTWTAQLDATSRNLQVVYTPGAASIVATASDSGTAPRTTNWTTGTNQLSWTGGTPGTGGNPDQATLNLSSTSTSGDYGVDLNQNLTLNKLTVNMSGTVNYRIGTGTRRTLTWVPLGTDTAVLEFVRISGMPLRNSLDSNSVLSTSLLARFAHQGSKDSYFGGIVSGSGQLTIDYYNSVNGSTGGNLRIGTAGDAASTHTGGTKLMMTTSDLTPANYRFYAAKVNAFGTGLLELNKARVDLNAFNQTVGGLGDGANGSILTDLSTSTANSSTSTLTLSFLSSSGAKSYAGQITDGTIRKIALTKAGSGTQTLSGVNTYTGATTISAGKLIVNGSLAAGSATTVAAAGTLGGSGTVSGSLNNLGTLTPGDSLGTLTTGALTLGVASKLEIQVANWASSTPGTGWDQVVCSSLNLTATVSQPLVIKVASLSITNFAETAKTLTIATSTAAITGFSTGAISIDSTAMPGTGTWTVQLDGTARNLQLVYTPLGAMQQTLAIAAPTTAESEVIMPEDPSIGGLGFASMPVAGGSDGAVVAEARVNGKDKNGKPLTNLTFTIVVRRGAEFASTNGAQVSAEIDKLIYRVEASSDQLVWDAAVTDLGASNLPPAGSGLPNLRGSEWEYHSFSAFEGTQDPGVIRAVLVNP